MAESIYLIEEPWAGIEVLLSSVSGLRTIRAPGRIARPRTRNPQQILRIERARYAKLETDFRMDLQRMAPQLLSGELSERQFIKRFGAKLYDFQVYMYMQGRRTAGNKSNRINKTEARWLHGQHSQEMKWLHGFTRRIRTGTGKMDPLINMDLYGLGGYSIYLRGVIAGTPDSMNQRWGWKVNPRSEHCPDCLRLEELSARIGGFTTYMILHKTGVPGEKVQCLHRCTCHLELIGGHIPLVRTRPTSFKYIRTIMDADERRETRTGQTSEPQAQTGEA